MKKFAICFIACLALVQSSYAATSGLVESLLEYETIISTLGAPDQNIIPVDEFIIDIKRLTKTVDNLGVVNYLIVTRPISETTDDSHKNHSHKVKYYATLNIEANPGIGPNVITVIGIVKSKHSH